MPNHPVVSREEWLTARRALLLREKEATRLRDAVNAERLALPWVPRPCPQRPDRGRQYRLGPPTRRVRTGGPCPAFL